MMKQSTYPSLGKGFLAFVDVQQTGLSFFQSRFSAIARSLAAIALLLFAAQVLAAGNHAEEGGTPNLLVDVTVSNTAPGATDVFKYKIRYRCASITEHCLNAHITYTIPDALDIVSVPAVGGNVASVTVTGNMVDISLVSPASSGAPPGALAAGSSGILETQVRFKCGTNGVAPIGAVGAPLNFAPAGLPVFSVTGGAQTAAAPADVTTPSVSACAPPPGSDPPTDLQKKPEAGTYGGTAIGGSIAASANSYVSWEVPAHSISATIEDIFPEKMYPVDFSVSGLPSDFGLPGGATLWVYSNGSWYNITASVGPFGNSLLGWIQSFAVGAPLLADGGVNTGSVRARMVYANGTDENWGSNLTGIRLVTGSSGSGALVNYVHYHVGADIPPGVYTNCITSNNPSWTSSCTNLDVAPEKPYVTIYGLGDYPYWPAGGNLGSSSFSPSVFYPAGLPTTKQPDDVLIGAKIEDYRSNNVDLNGFIVELLMPSGWDFVTTGENPNYWIATINGSPILSPTCETPIFTRVPNYNGTGRTFLKWEFPTCVMPKHATASINGTGSPLVVLGLTSRWMGTTPLPSSVLHNFVLKSFNGEQLARFNAYAPSAQEAWSCEDYVEGSAIWTFPTSGANTDSWKDVKGALDTDFSRYPDVGNTNLNGDGVYEMYIKNTGFEAVKQLDFADVLPYIGDKSMLSGGSRGSLWSAELANAITIEKFSIGSGWASVPGGELPLGIMYSTDYNGCYLDAGNQLDADPAQANTGQSAGCTDMSTGTPAAGAKSFSFRWLNAADPLTFGEALRITVNIRQLTGEADKTNGEIAWNSFAYTATLPDNSELFSSEPIKVGLKMVDPATTAAIGDYVWIDANSNGRQDAGETPAEGVQVSLYDAAGNPALNGAIPVTTHTDINGYYCFPGLTPNTNYSVRLQDATDFSNGGPLTGYSLTTQNAAGVPDDQDSDAALGTLAGSPPTPRPQIASPTGAAGTQTKTYDFGFNCLGTISGYVWMDTDNGGDQDGTEMALSGVTATLKNAATNATVGTPQVSNGLGQLLFANVPAGVYYIEYSAFPGSKIPTSKDLTGNDNNDSDVNANGKTDNFSLGSCDFLDFDLGLKDPPANPGAICGTAWDDLNKDGAFQGTEPGVANVTVQLLDGSGFVINATTTDASGNYCFINLEPNMPYSVAFVPTVGMMFSVAGPDQDVDLVSGITLVQYTPTANQTINDVDAGLMGALSLGNQVWNDLDNNGLFNSEPVFANLTVRLIANDGATVLGTTTTDANGRYVFKLLNAGTYYVEVEVPATYLSSTDIGTSGTPNGVDNDDNGVGSPVGGFIRSNAITLANNGGASGDANWTEYDNGVPINGLTDPSSNPKAYYTVDFGFRLMSSCTQPSAPVFTQVAPGCNGSMALNNGTITLTAVTDGTHFGVSTLNAGSYDGPTTVAGATPIILAQLIQNNIPNTGGTYIVRIFNGADNCFIDQPVTVSPVTCNCPVNPCGSTTVIKN